jgi:quercetin dioxygenase-like cupin family protein
MDLYVNGMKTLVTTGNIIHLQAYEAHGMVFHDPVKYRGFFHGLANYDNQPEMYILRKKNPQIMQDPEFMRIRETGVTGGGRDFYVREKPVWVDVPIEENPSVRNINRPLATFCLDGITLKQMTRRWENGGRCEMWAAEMDKGFKAASGQYLNHAELYYVTAGQVKFTIWDEEYVAEKECVVKIPALANFSISALTDAVMYDVGGVPRWQAYLEDRASILHYDPERGKDPATFAALREKFGVQIAVG